MAEKLGSNVMEYMARLGLEELRAANSGQQVEAPVIPPPEAAAPQVEAPAQQSYAQMIDRQADMAPSQEKGGFER